MSALVKILAQRRMVFSIVTLLSLAGILAWYGMVRQEDPAFPYRYGFVLVQFPGADILQMERLVAEPLEEALTEVEEVDEIRTTIRAGFLHTILGMKQTVYDTDTAWDRVRDAVDRVYPELPDGVLPAVIDDEQVDASTLVLAISGSSDLIELQQAAKRLRKRLYQLPEIAKIDLLGDSGEQVAIQLRRDRLQMVGLTQQDLTQQLQQRNQIIPGGFVNIGQRQTTIRPQSEFYSIDEIRQLPVMVGGAQSLPLDWLAEVELQVVDPVSEAVWMNGQQVVALALTVSNNTVNVVHFGEKVRHYLDDLRDEFAPLQIQTMFFQPQRVQERLTELGRSLLLGVFIVAVVLFLLMGGRMGLVVALVVPLVAFSALAVFAMGGGVLHQMAVAGMVIALGMLVDNAIVMVENIQWHLDRGAQSTEAAVTAVQELLGPLGAATGTTLAVFVPMLISRGDTADFTRAVPAMIMLMLIISYLYAVFVTPLLSERLLLARRRGVSRSRMARVGSAIGQLAVQNRWLVLLATFAMLALSVFLSGFLDKDFFPTTDRNQLVVDVHYPEGTPIEVTTEFVQNLSTELAQLDKVSNIYAFSGSSGPRFYYNLNETPRAPHVGRVVVETDSDADLPGVIHWLREQTAQRWPDPEVIVKRLAQGPPTPAPVEFRISGTNKASIVDAAEKLMAYLRSVPGTVDVRHNIGIGLPTVEVRADDAVLETRGLNRVNMARSLATQTQGLEIGTYRAWEDPIPVVLKSGAGTASSLTDLQMAYAYSEPGRIPLAHISEQRVRWQPAVLYRQDLLSAAMVYSELEDGFTYGSIYQQVFSVLPELGLPGDVSVTAGGAQKSSGEANAALYQTLPIGLILLLFFLLLQFNSYRRVFIVLVTVPLAIAGVVPGLLISGYSFGFMALLGVVALVGIVVNNAIVLIDVIDANLQRGLNIAAAVHEAVARRTRPILLTTLTTVAGLLPLTFASSTLWPPMAWTIISGLLASTILTLCVVPVLCYWLLESAQAPVVK